MRAILTVVGPDRVGITAELCTLLAKHQINIVDISQTVMQGFFTMMMLVDLSGSSSTLEAVQEDLQKKQEETGLSIRMQREDIFQSMHRI